MMQQLGFGLLAWAVRASGRQAHGFQPYIALAVMWPCVACCALVQGAGVPSAQL
jgi:hypothetical protein